MTSRLRCPFRCGSVVRARPRDDGYAFPGRRECRAHVESPSKKIYISPHRDSSRLDEWFLNGGCAGSQRPPPVPFSRKWKVTRSWKALPACKIVEGAFNCPKQILKLLPPHHPRWWSRFGVHGHPLSGAGLWPCNCVQTAATTLRVDPCLTGLFVLSRSNWQCL